MTILTLIAEPFPDAESSLHRGAAEDLARALAATAPRGCSIRYLTAKDQPEPQFRSPIVRAEALPVRSKALPHLWRSPVAARPLDGEIVHTTTPLAPLRQRTAYDGSQSSVTVPHSIAWEYPELLGTQAARNYRNYARRALRLADIVFTHTHATADVLHRTLGEDFTVQVLPLAPPSAYARPDDAVERRAALGVPEHYMITSAAPSEPGRLAWVFDALLHDATLPPVVVLLLPGFDASSDAEIMAACPDEIRHRVITVSPREHADVGAVLAGASLLAQPQVFLDSGYLLLAALHAAVPVLHTGYAATAELVLDAGVCAEQRGSFTAELSLLFTETNTLTQLAVLARDRSKAFQWKNTAWQLWEAHADL